MLKKIKKFLKNNIFGIIIGGIIFGTAGVYAATYFPSNDVTYDNSTSGLSSTNVQGAIDELYSTCINPPTPPVTVGGQEVEIVTSGDGFYKDEYEEGRYVYKGENPNNYITFNNEKAGWRIISVEADGTIKIIKTLTEDNFKNKITDQYWDTSGNNYWPTSSLQSYLNQTYYNSFNAETKSKIINHDFNIGKITESNNDLIDQIYDEKATKWNGNIGLITISEFLRANSNKSQCATYSLYNSNVNTCEKTNWLDLPYIAGFWTISADVNNSSCVFYINTYGIYGATVNKGNTMFVLPVVYLPSSTRLNGNGTPENPFVLP